MSTPTELRAPGLHVLLVSNTFDTDPGAGGTEVLTADLASALVARSVQVSWLAAPSTPEPDAASAGPHRQVRRIATAIQSAEAPPIEWQSRENGNRGMVLAALRDVPRVDLVHLLHFSRFGLGAFTGERLQRVPMVATLTDYTAICADYQMVHRGHGRPCRAPVPASECAACLAVQPSPGPATAVEIGGWRRHNLAVLNRRCSAIWVQTPHQRSELTRAGLNPRRIVRDTASYAVPEHWHRRRTPSGGTPTLLFLGRASPDKGLHILLDAFQRWPVPARLLVVTRPDNSVYERRLRKVAESDGRVDWLPPVCCDDLGDLIAEATALVLPSQWNDNHPIVVQYAMALGVPVLCSAVPSLAHLTSLGDVRFVDRYTDPVAWVAGLDDLVANPTTADSRLSEFRHGWAALVDHTLGVYIELTKSR